MGIHTVDSFDIHTSILEYRNAQDKVCKKHGKVSIISAGWDPGSDSVVRVLMQSLAPKGLSYTNFGPGMSMGHSVCVKGKQGVRDALSMTIPLGEGIHRRMVYVELEEGANLEEVTKAIKADPYFAHDETHGERHGTWRTHGKERRERQDAEPAFRVQYEHQQPRPHGTSAGQRG